MSNTTHLAVDAMGGDFGPRLSTAASLRFVETHPDVVITLVGDQEQLRLLLPEGHPRLRVVHASQSVAMDERPGSALRHKQDSSMWRTLEMVSQRSAHAGLSAGNTGALVAISRHLLGTFSDVERPAICKPIPTSHGYCFILDLGANLDCTAEQLVQFGIMGSAVAKLKGLVSPRVALLNVGSEASKGRESLRCAAQNMAGDARVDFIGFVEGDGIYKGVADVVVCDGFTGNVALKASEGVAWLLAHSLKDWFKKGLWRRLIGYVARPILLEWWNDFSPARYNGALLLGLDGLVVKSHGGADQEGFECALAVAYEHALFDTTTKVKASLRSA